MDSNVTLADRVEDSSHVFTAAGNLGEVIKPHGGDDDVDNWDQSEDDALACCQETHAQWHLIAKDGDE